jgi:hypothetical protein
LVTAVLTVPSKSVRPSGRALATISALRLPPAPVQFSTTKVELVDSLRICAMMRATQSAVPPAAYGTTRRWAGSRG